MTVSDGGTHISSSLPGNQETSRKEKGGLDITANIHKTPLSQKLLLFADVGDTLKNNEHISPDFRTPKFNVLKYFTKHFSAKTSC